MTNRTSHRRALSALLLPPALLASLAAAAQDRPTPEEKAPAAQEEPAPAEKAPAVLDEDLLARAGAALAAGRAQEAFEQFARLAAAAPPDRRVLLGLGRAQAALGEAAAAVDTLVSALRLSEDDPDVLLALADALFLQGRQAAWDDDPAAAGLAFLDARRFYDQAAAERPEAAPWLGAARVEREQGRRDEALQLALRAHDLDARHVDTLLEIGSLRFDAYWEILGMQGAEAAADAKELCRRVYLDVLAIEADNGFAMNGLGWVDMQAGDAEAAIEWFRQSLVANPTIDDSYENLGRLLAGSLEDRKRYARLLDDVVEGALRFRDGDERRRGRARALYERGLAAAGVRDGDLLDRDLAEAARLDPDLAAACCYQRARGLARDGRQEEAARILGEQAASGAEAFAALQAVVASQPDPRDEALLIRSLADNAYRAGDLQAARDLFRLSAETLETSADDWNNYAFFCRETGRYEESYAAYLRALDIDGGNPNLLNDAALILHYHLRRDLEHAAELYQRAIEEGKRVLADPAADSFARENAATAVQDAGNNLRLLRAGATRPGAGRRTRQ
ncbi:MAG: hypothetical protein HY812_06685 [Planctomycetes bacterium]|nr:hypothetical protein [Planctomycetota bacterium]